MTMLRQDGLRDPGATTAQVRGDIQSGLTGDKVAGDDPSAAPLGTDEEAGGASLDPQLIARTREAEKAARPARGTVNAASPQLAPDGAAPAQRSLLLPAALGVGLAIIMALILFAALHR
jgi:hypothetical protein